MSKKNKDGVFSLLRQILAEQKKQTKILQAIESSQEQAKRNWKSAIPKEKVFSCIPIPHHQVKETNDFLLIDNFPISFVVKDSVKSKVLSEENVLVTVSFIAKSFEDVTTKND